MRTNTTSDDNSGSIKRHLIRSHNINLWGRFELSANGCSRSALSARGWLNQVENGCDHSTEESVFQIGREQRDFLKSDKNEL